MTTLTKSLKDFRKVIDNRFDGVDKRFDSIDKRLDEVEDIVTTVDKQVDQLTLKMITGFDRVNKRIDNTENKFDKRFDEVLTVIDGYAAKLDTYAQEMAAMDHKLKRLEKYIEVLADKVGVDLDKVTI